MSDKEKAIIQCSDCLQWFDETTAGYDDGKLSVCGPCCDKRAGESVAKKYNELIMAVQNKFPGETRHESALRLIKKAESSDSGCVQSQ